MCTDSVNVEQDGDNHIPLGRLGIVPRLNFTCNGRIAEIMASVKRFSGRGRLRFQVWRSLSTNSMVYANIGEVQLLDSQVSQCNSDRFCNANIVLTDNDKIEFQSGDVIGWYQPSDVLYRLRTIQTIGYVQYEFDGPLSSLDLNNADRSDNQRQPLIQFVIGS